MKVNHSSGNRTVKTAYLTSVLFFCAYPLPSSLHLYGHILIFLSRRGSLQSVADGFIKGSSEYPLNNEEQIINGLPNVYHAMGMQSESYLIQKRSVPLLN